MRDPLSEGGDAVSTALIVASAVGVSMLAVRFQSEQDEKQAPTASINGILGSVINAGADP